MSAAIVMSFTGSVPTAPANYLVDAGLAYGSNGNSASTPELTLGQGSDFSSANYTWDSDPDPSDPFDSGLVPVDIVIPVGGGANSPDTLTIGGGTSSPIILPVDGGLTGAGGPGTITLPDGGGIGDLPILPTNSIGDASVSYGDSSYGKLGGVVIDLGTQTNGSVSWSGLTVNFMHDGEIVDSWSSADGAQVDTTTAPNPVAGQEIDVTPTATQSIDSIEITGSMEMTAPAGTYPGADDLFSDIYIMGAM